MRADRLLALLMLLQGRGRMTARQLAEELEVSERTIYRDIDALCTAGVPVYSETGREGGYALLDSYRTSLTGMTDGEIQALFMLNIPAPLGMLGVGQELKSALLKLSASLPDRRREGETRVRQRFHLDSTWWDQGEEPVPYLQTIYRAVWEDRRLILSYRPIPNVTIEQRVDPYGLVAKAGVWYLVCSRQGQIQVHRVSDILEAHLMDELFERRAAFDLERFWAGWCAEEGRNRSGYPIRVRVAPGLLPWLPRLFGHRLVERLESAGPADADGWTTMNLSFESPTEARSSLLALGGGVEVLEPLALRLSVQDYAEQIIKLYYGLYIGQDSLEI